MNFTEEDIANIKAAIIAGGKIWDNTLLVVVKRKIKNHNRYLQSQQCCYCRRSLADEFNLVIDIEHVLPKGDYSEFMFDLFNLSVSCKRCNMEIKKDDVSFISDINAVRANPKDSDLYKLIHPNLDNFFAHISYHVAIANTKNIVKYQIINDSPKGDYTYNYFELDKIENEALNQAQGIAISEKLSEIIDPAIADEIRNLLRS